MHLIHARRLLLLLLALLFVLPAFATEDPFVSWLLRQQEKDIDPPTFSPLVDLRVRQEKLTEVYWFDSELAHRNRIRYRTKLGLRYLGGDHRVELRLANEFRKVIEPETEILNWDEIILDRACWTWGLDPNGPFTLNLGRQDIIWDDGFLMFEGNPYDGSRAIYQNAARLQLRGRHDELELLGIANPRKDPLVVHGSQDRPLHAHDEYAAALRWKRDTGTSAAIIWKKEREIDEPNWEWCALTMSLRQEWRGLTGEFALQHQSIEQWAYALQTSAERELVAGGCGEVGFFLYSGATEDGAAFHTPFGRWPKWSELYIVSLAGEGGVAAWENIAAFHLHWRQELTPELKLRGSAYLLSAPEPDWTSRGQLFQVELAYALTETLGGHLLWETLRTGDWPEAQDKNAHFLRWEIRYRLD